MRERFAIEPPSNLYKQSLKEDVSHLARQDIINLLRFTTAEETAKQKKLGNKAQMVTVDGYKNKPVSQAEKKVVVLFGDSLARMAMSLVESTLAGTISRSTNSVSGKLKNVKSNWEWLFLRNNSPIQFPYDDQGGLQFQAKDKLVLKPKNVPYASIVNMNVSKGDRSLSMRTRKSKRNPTGVSKRNQSMGFMGATTAILKKNPVFKNFNVYVQFSRKYKVAGEVSRTQGSPCIVISSRGRFYQ